MKKIEEFLNELTELTNKYGLYISACGCCNSPWIVDTDTDETVVEGLWYDKETKKYE